MPSASNGRERKPRGRSGSSTMLMPEAKTFSPRFSRRKLVLRATELPLAALARWPTSEPEILAIKHHRHAAGGDFTRIEAFDRAFAGASPDRLRAFEVGGMQCGGEIVVALHPRAVAGNCRHGDAVTRRDGGAVKAVARYQHQPADAGRGRGAARFGDAGDRKTGCLRFAGARFQHNDVRHVGVDEIKRRQLLRQLACGGKPGEPVFRRGARHRHRAFGQGAEAVAFEIIGRDHRLFVADDDAQPEVVAFGALRFLDRAVAHLDRKRHRADRKRVGLIGAGPLCGSHKTLGEVGEVGLVEKRTHLMAGLCGEGREHKGKM